MVSNIAGAIAAYRQSADGAIAGVKKKGDGGEAEGAGSFASTLNSFIGDGVKALKQAEQTAAAGTVGKANLQEVIMAVGKAEMMLQTVTAIRDKVITAYQDIIRMPV